jgi:hypothetical protein
MLCRARRIRKCLLLISTLLVILMLLWTENIIQNFVTQSKETAHTIIKQLKERELCGYMINMRRTQM